MDQPEVIAEMYKNPIEKVVASLSMFKDKKRFDIRIFYQVDARQFIPTRKGINLDVYSWQEFKEMIDKLDQAIKGNKKVKGE